MLNKLINITTEITKNEKEINSSVDHKLLFFNSIYSFLIFLVSFVFYYFISIEMDNLAFFIRELFNENNYLTISNIITTFNITENNTFSQLLTFVSRFKEPFLIGTDLIDLNQLKSNLLIIFTLFASTKFFMGACHFFITKKIINLFKNGDDFYICYPVFSNFLFLIFLGMLSLPFFTGNPNIFTPNLKYIEAIFFIIPMLSFVNFLFFYFHFLTCDKVQKSKTSDILNKIEENKKLKKEEHILFKDIVNNKKELEIIAESATNNEYNNEEINYINHIFNTVKNKKKKKKDAIKRGSEYSTIILHNFEEEKEDVSINIKTT